MPAKTKNKLKNELSKKGLQDSKNIEKGLQKSKTFEKEQKIKSYKDIKGTWRKIWYFIWEDNSVWSWIVNVILAFVLIKFLVYPGLGLILGTNYPIVAVVSSSMEHDGNFDSWWAPQESYYSQFGISKDDFINYTFKNGFNKGDIMVLKGLKPENIELGDVIVFRSDRPDPIIHRVVKKWPSDGSYYFQTKGDHNPRSMDMESKIAEDEIIGKAIFRIPFLGYIKIWFVEFVKLFIK